MRLLLAAALCLSPVSAAAADDRRPNVLFIAVDDLRPELGCYGKTHIHSPNIDRLAAGGFVFERAYCMVPTCGASRASLMTSIRPAAGRFVGYKAWAERDAPGATTLNTHFKKNGYHTISNGKIFHNPGDNAEGWSEPPWRPRRTMPYKLAESRKAAAENSPGRGPAYEAADAPDDAYADGKLAERAIQDLRRLATQSDPFFLAVGFFKPHLPFVAPRKYWDLYDREQIRLPATYHRPKDAPDEAIHRWGELRAYAGIPSTGPLSDEQARTLIHGYYACVSFTDAQIGKVLDELDRLGLAENTIVVFWADHGWNLGEHTLWCKHCCFETSMRVPLIVRGPGVPGGKRTRGLTELIDIYPSLCELAGLPLPGHLQGRSFVPLMQDPELAWSDAAIGRFGNGDTIRTDRYRLTEYTRGGGNLLARMLYDHRADPQEDVNIASQEETEDVVKRLSEKLRAEMGKDWKEPKSQNVKR